MPRVSPTGAGASFAESAEGARESALGTDLDEVAVLGEPAERDEAADGHERP